MRQRGFTVTELISATGIIMMVIVATVALLIQCSQELATTSSETKLNNLNAQGLRAVSDKLRQAMSVTITDSSYRIHYVLPKVSTTKDAVTGEYEFMDPIQSDGVARSFFVNTSRGWLRDEVDNHVYVRNIRQRDPDPKSSQYNIAYQPFQLTTVGSSRAVTITLITTEMVGTKRKYVRLKTTVLLRNFSS